MSSQPESSYIGRHAELYDLFYADKPYLKEAAFIHQCIQSFSPKAKQILELACGTGTHSMLLEKYGYQIIATDYSTDMLRRAREKAKISNSSVEFRLQDMRNLDVAERPFEAIFCLFDSLGYVTTNESISRVLDSVHDHLSANGLFIFEFWHAGAFLRGYDPVRIRRWHVPDGEILRISETQIDYQKQLCEVSYSIYEFKEDGKYNHLQETQINRFFLLQEMAKFLDEAGLKPLKWYAGFQTVEMIDDQVWHIVALARKN